MKKTFTSFPFRLVLAAIMFVVASFSAASVSAQVVSAVSTSMTTDAFPAGSVWKSATDYAAVITSERASNLLLLGAPNLKVAKRALYTGYDRMLGYIQADLSANAPLEDIAEINFRRVSLESATDPNLLDMPADEFNTMYVTLVGKLKN